MSNIICFCERTTVIARLHCLFSIGKAVSSTIELVNSVTSNYINLFNFAMWAFASKWFPIEVVPCSDGWRRTWWQIVCMIPGLPVSPILQWKYNHHEDACLALFEAKMICKVRSLKSLIKTRSLLEEIITSSNEVYKDFQSHMPVGIWKLCNPTWETAKSYLIVKQIAGS